jgi:hypothetical protein
MSFNHSVSAFPNPKATVKLNSAFGITLPTTIYHRSSRLVAGHAFPTLPTRLACLVTVILHAHILISFQPIDTVCNTRSSFTTVSDLPQSRQLPSDTSSFTACFPANVIWPCRLLIRSRRRSGRICLSLAAAASTQLMGALTDRPLSSHIPQSPPDTYQTGWRRQLLLSPVARTVHRYLSSPVSPM